MEIIIKDSFKDNLPKLSEEEFRQLEVDILQNGCRDPLVLWKGKNILVDGHHRYAICTKHNISYKIFEMDTKKTVPLLVSDSNHARPPCASAICLTMVKPSPEPSVRFAEGCFWNISNMTWDPSVVMVAPSLPKENM